MSRKAKPPAYRKRRLPQGARAYLTLHDSQTGRSKDYNLGPYGSDESRERYHRLITEWETAGRRLPAVTINPNGANGLTVTQLCHAYHSAVKGRYSRSHEANQHAAIRLLRELYGTWPVASFGPNALRLVRESMILGNPQAKPKPRRPWSRSVANRSARYLIQVFKWGVAHEMVAPGTYQALRTIEPLKFGQTTAHEPEPVKPVPGAFVDAALEFMRPQVRAMVELQRATGMRPGEVTAMRTRDVDTSGATWVYTLTAHKTAHRGHRRTVYIGPRGQRVLREWLRTNLDEHLFQPSETVSKQLAERHARRTTAMSCGNRPGTNRSANPKRSPRDRYTSTSYRRAIARACDQANRKAKADATEGGRNVKAEERLIPRWHPHQLRHNYATEVRRQYGLEAAQILLGHSSALITDAVYAERDMAKAMEIAAKIG